MLAGMVNKKEDSAILELPEQLYIGVSWVSTGISWVVIEGKSPNSVLVAVMGKNIFGKKDLSCFHMYHLQCSSDFEFYEEYKIQLDQT